MSSWIIQLVALAAVAVTILAMTRSVHSEFRSVGPSHESGANGFLRDELLCGSIIIPFYVWLLVGAFGWGQISGWAILIGFVVALGLVFLLRFSPPVTGALARCEAARASVDQAASQ